MADKKDKEVLDENYNLDEDFEDEEEIVTLLNEDTQKEEDFRVVHITEYEDKSYIFLNPVEPSDDIADDEVLICEIGENEQGEEFILPIEDEKTLQAVYAQYVKEYEAMAEEAGIEGEDLQ